ncbi:MULTISPECIES: hypothetical protein [Micromonospora]|uniref:Uncharacterized protein n=1 Tax=Micromonospora solifontis TaxID=2487138 RepID=A0ABX9WLJ7_9ACTN|nr:MULTISPECIES: hypothetical protein [Micromonospora]NES13666.1 hypothetical protein [Micromonospora sp. PPF5-17B]NES35475.1 hypothetical protein [Micromonospora solifontis]NES55368.1 hypothetical protein [Micromonospora sp. PPF5-6]RNM00725.1 hypothetical protein EFE23_04770 [Micromonospora solifontis]
MRRRLALVALVLLVVGGIGYAGLRAAYHRAAKDQRDVAALTGSSPWPREQLLIPDGSARPGNVAFVSDDGLEVAYHLDPGDGRSVPVLWGLRVPQPRTGLPEGVDCGSPRLRTCTDLGGGELLMVTRKTDNSNPSTALYRADGGRVRSVEVQGPDPVEVDALRAALDRVHRPTDAELLELLRHEGYRTDWS